MSRGGFINLDNIVHQSVFEERSEDSKRNDKKRNNNYNHFTIVKGSYCS